MRAMEKGVPIRSLSRGLAVLQAVNRGGSLTLMQIARVSQVPYATACRLVQTLVYEGLLEQEPTRKRYRPTALVQTLSHGFHGDGLLVQTARPHIVDLTRRVGWPITLSTRVGHSMIIRDSTHSLTALTFNSYYPGFTMPILESASGIVVLAHMADDEREQLLESMKLLPKISAPAVIDLFQKENLAREVRAQGYAVRMFNQFTANPGKTSSVAVPILDGDQVVGALTLAFFARAAKVVQAEQTFVAPLLEAAGNIAEALKAKEKATEIELGDDPD